ncbi:MAG: tetratricopeptide repeat protein [Janthinobacterium lividum]
MRGSLLRVGLGMLLLAAGYNSSAQDIGAPAPADTVQTRWLDIDSTPWLRGIRRVPPAHERTEAYWRALVQAHPQPDTVRAVLLDRLAEAQAAQDLRASYPTHLAALQLAFQLPYSQIRAEMLLALADYHTQLAQYDSAAHYLPAAEQQFRLDHNQGGVARCLIRLGRITEQQGRYAASLSYNLQALELANTGNSRRFRTSAQIQLGKLYAQVGDYTAAHTYLVAAQRAAEHYDYPDRLNLALGELGEVSRQQRQWVAARKYYTQSIAISRRIGEQSSELAMQLNLVRLAEAQGQYATARTAAEQVLARMEAAHQVLLVPLAQALLARLLLRQGQAAQAITYAIRSQQASQLLRLPTGVREASAVLVQAYTQRHDYRLALAALRRYNASNDSLAGETVRRRIAVLQLGQQQREQQAQIRLLTQQNRLQTQTQELAQLRAQRELIGLSALTMLALLLAGGALWQYRRRQARHEAQLRSQIAADLHDDVGTLLSQISLQSSLLQEGLVDAAGQRQQLGQLSEASRSAVRQLNDVVWNLDAHNDALPQLLDRLHDYAHEVLAPAGIAVAVEAPATPPDLRLSLLLRRNFYFIYKEALHNILKHATGTPHVRVRLALEAGRLLLEISNDAAPVLVPAGNAAPTHQRRSGHGLRNIGQRAAAVGGTAECGPLPAGGFRVSVQLPLGG